jgi:hypothetical protein
MQAIPFTEHHFRSKVLSSQTNIRLKTLESSSSRSLSQTIVAQSLVIQAEHNSSFFQAGVGEQTSDKKPRLHHKIHWIDRDVNKILNF